MSKGRLHTIGRMFAKLAQLRRVATRYDRLNANYQGLVTIAVAMPWLNPWGCDLIT